MKNYGIKFYDDDFNFYIDLNTANWTFSFVPAGIAQQIMEEHCTFSALYKDEEYEVIMTRIEQTKHYICYARKEDLARFIFDLDSTN